MQRPQGLSWGISDEILADFELYMQNSTLLAVHPNSVICVVAHRIGFIITNDDAILAS